MHAGQVLGFEFLRRGARAHVVVAGGIDVLPILGGRSAYVLGALGGLDGRALRTGDVLLVGIPARTAGRCRKRCCRGCIGTGWPRRRRTASLRQIREALRDA